MKVAEHSDSLFLSAQAQEILGLHDPVFGKVAIASEAIPPDAILYLRPDDASPLPPLSSVSAVICAASDTRVDLLRNTYSGPLIIVEPDIVFTSGDIISVSLRGRIHRHFRSLSKNNAFLVTEVCNNLCIMCPQPPKPESQVSHADIERRIMQTLALIDEEKLPDTLCITGGEPTMLKDGMIRIVEKIAERAPQALIHLLTNGRYFSNEAYTARLSQAANHQLLAGIPLFGHVADIHDYVVQSQGAFDQTLNGLLNCYKQGINVELRVVLHKTTVEYLAELAEYITRNLFFVKHVALMGMENMGLAKLNRDAVFIDPWDYKDILSEAVHRFEQYGIEVRIFNLPLCVVNVDTQPYCVKSISDFKNSWHSACEACSQQQSCCGFFSSSTEKFYLTQHVQPFAAT
ncbi:His-Xaa-Ser system radical SAM maturase HxsC [Scandinavium goeteborgense]|uniref:His-Xaa-Ser system radical SAM maturase HxsC n=1 Tax=Scandinavium goeteborgense TaxID=1851514 RepID=A0A4R6EGR6_SCAGO|nr:His-Xaa-Ser system radical SAM maturase HxsC [Scandinavium goeteborgense]TDN56587.1 His-Xaa-Ser system radical SAM maturase HxsC [Scandinavium goeteborgense]